MRIRGITQEQLKLMACAAMLIDHIGYLFVPGYHLRAIGRIAFPIFCFLVAEGSHYTRSPKKYALRLALSALISEFAYDFFAYGGWSWRGQNVMVTLLLGFLAVQTAKRCKNFWAQWLAVLPFFFLAELVKCDYGGVGVVLIALFALNREQPRRNWLYFLGMVFLLDWIGGPSVRILGQMRLPLAMFGLAAFPLILAYSGEKQTSSRWIQWGFYLFYPVHMVLLRLLK